jgi:hypothetical protein
MARSSQLPDHIRLGKVHPAEIGLVGAHPQPRGRPPADLVLSASSSSPAAASSAMIVPTVATVATDTAQLLRNLGSRLDTAAVETADHLHAVRAAKIA